MLNKVDAIRIDRKYIKSRKREQLLYIFLCLGCSNEMALQVSYIPQHSGYCRKCQATFRHHGEVKPFLSLYKRFQRAAKKRNHSFALTYEQFLWFTEIGICRYCGDPVQWTEHDHGPFNLDRKDYSKGYTIDNVCVCCSKCNYMKSRFFTEKEFAATMTFIKLWRNLSEIDKKELEYVILSWNDILQEVE